MTDRCQKQRPQRVTKRTSLLRIFYEILHQLGLMLFCVYENLLPSNAEEQASA
jgi:hypothetical protein